MAATAPQERLDLPADVPQLRHHFERQDGAEHLLVTFTGYMSRVANPGQPRWAYRHRVLNLPVHRLYVDTQIGVLPERSLDLAGLVRFSSAALYRTGIPEARTIASGSSLGGAAALLVAAELGLRHAVVGAPSIHFGRHVLADPAFGTAEEARRVLATWGTTVESLDSAVLDAVARTRAPLDVDLLIGMHDERHPEVTDALAAVCARNPCTTLRTTVLATVDHSNVSKPYGRHLCDTVLHLVALHDAGGVRAADRALATVPDGHVVHEALQAVVEQAQQALLRQRVAAAAAQRAASRRRRWRWSSVGATRLRLSSSVDSGRLRASSARRGNWLDSCPPRSERSTS